MRRLTPKDIGAIVREARLEASTTQAQLGEKIGATRFWVAEFERGKPRAEVGLVLKALHALELELTIEPAGSSTHRARQSRDDGLEPQPDVDLSAIIARASTPTGRR